MATFISRTTDNNNLLEAAAKVPERCSALPDGGDKEAMSTIVAGITALVAFAVASRTEAGKAEGEWKRAQGDRDLCDQAADTALRRAKARLVDWDDMKRAGALVLAFFPNGLRPFIEAADEEPDMIVLLLEAIAKSMRPGLTPERKAELESILRPTVAPFADARDRARIARLRSRMTSAVHDRDVDEVWLAARKAYSLASLQLPAAVVESVFASMLVASPSAPAADPTVPAADKPIV